MDESIDRKHLTLDKNFQSDFLQVYYCWWWGLFGRFFRAAVFVLSIIFVWTASTNYFPEERKLNRTYLFPPRRSTMISCANRGVNRTTNWKEGTGPASPNFGTGDGSNQRTTFTWRLLLRTRTYWLVSPFEEVQKFLKSSPNNSITSARQTSAGATTRRWRRCPATAPPTPSWPTSSPSTGRRTCSSRWRGRKIHRIKRRKLAPPGPTRKPYFTCEATLSGSEIPKKAWCSTSKWIRVWSILGDPACHSLALNFGSPDYYFMILEPWIRQIGRIYPSDSKYLSKIIRPGNRSRYGQLNMVVFLLGRGGSIGHVLAEEDMGFGIGIIYFILPQRSMSYHQEHTINHYIPNYVVKSDFLPNHVVQGSNSNTTAWVQFL